MGPHVGAHTEPHGPQISFFPWFFFRFWPRFFFRFWTPFSFSLNILLRVFSIPGGECVSIVLAGLAFSRPPPCNTRGGYYYYFFFFSCCSPALLNYIGAFWARPDFRYTNFFLLAKECQGGYSQKSVIFLLFPRSFKLHRGVLGETRF